MKTILPGLINFSIFSSMKKLFILVVLLSFLTGYGQGKNITEAEYEVLNKAIDFAIQPLGFILPSSKELNEVNQRYHTDLSNLSEKDKKIINKALAEKRKYEFALSDTLLEVSTREKKYSQIIERNSIKPVAEKLPSAVMNNNMLKLPEGYRRISKKSDQNPGGQFIGNIQIERVIFDQSEKKAMVSYMKCENFEKTHCDSLTVRLGKMKNEWYVLN